MTQQGNQLTTTLKQLGIDDPWLDATAVTRLDKYARCLWEWNQQLNLTRHTNYETFCIRDIVDTLQLAKWIDEDQELLDIGSGGGVPGLTLAIIRPDLQISLCESTSKKARALGQIARHVGVEPMIYAERAEKVLTDFSFDLCTARAVGPIWKLCRTLQNHWAAGKRLLAIKGPRWMSERDEAIEKGFLSRDDTTEKQFPTRGDATEKRFLGPDESLERQSLSRNDATEKQFPTRGDATEKRFLDQDKAFEKGFCRHPNPVNLPKLRIVSKYPTPVINAQNYIIELSQQAGTRPQ